MKISSTSVDCPTCVNRNTWRPTAEHDHQRHRPPHLTHKDTTGPSRDFGGVCVPIRLAPLDFPAWPAAQVTTAWAPTRAYAQAYRQTLRDHDIAAQVEYAA